MLSHGVPLIVVSRQLGHANPNITAQVYAHLLEDAQLDDAARVFDAPLSAQALEETLDDAVHHRENRMGKGASREPPAAF
jgi:integrase